MNPSDRDMINLQKEVLEKPKVKKILGKRQPDGWIGDELHGGPGKGLDSSVFFLLNYGVEKENKMFGDVISLLHDEKEDVPYRTTFKGGEAMDTGGRGGNRAVKAGILAELGDENNPVVQEEIKISLSYLKASLEYESIDDFTLTSKNGIRYYKSDAHFPGANHLNLLSATKSWRTPENIDLVIKAMTQCFQIMKGHSYNIMLKSGAHFVGPFNFKWNLWDFDISEINEDSYALVWWLRDLYKLSKIGVISDIPELKKAYDHLWQLVSEEDLFHRQNDESLKRFKNILSVENSWRKKESAFCDVMFYGFMILFYAGYDTEKL